MIWKLLTVIALVTLLHLQDKGVEANPLGDWCTSVKAGYFADSRGECLPPSAGRR